MISCAGLSGFVIFFLARTFLLDYLINRNILALANQWPSTYEIIRIIDRRHYIVSHHHVKLYRYTSEPLQRTVVDDRHGEFLFPCVKLIIELAPPAGYLNVNHLLRNIMHAMARPRLSSQQPIPHADMTCAIKYDHTGQPFHNTSALYHALSSQI